MQFGINIQTLRMNILFISSGSKIKPRKEQAITRRASACFLSLTDVVLGLFFLPEDGGDISSETLDDLYRTV